MQFDKNVIEFCLVFISFPRYLTIQNVTFLDRDDKVRLNNINASILAIKKLWIQII